MNNDQKMKKMRKNKVNLRSIFNGFNKNRLKTKDHEKQNNVAIKWLYI